MLFIINFFFLELTYETFINLKPHHVKELVPNINDRVKLETVICSINENPELNEVYSEDTSSNNPSTSQQMGTISFEETSSNNPSTSQQMDTISFEDSLSRIPGSSQHVDNIPPGKLRKMAANNVGNFF